MCLLSRYLECCFENCLSLPVKFSTHYLLWPSLILEKMVCDSLFFFFFKINELGGWCALYRKRKSNVTV